MDHVGNIAAPVHVLCSHVDVGECIPAPDDLACWVDLHQHGIPDGGRGGESPRGEVGGRWSRAPFRDSPRWGGLGSRGRRYRGPYSGCDRQFRRCPRDPGSCRRRLLLWYDRGGESTIRSGPYRRRRRCSERSVSVPPVRHAVAVEADHVVALRTRCAARRVHQDAVCLGRPGDRRRVGREVSRQAADGIGLATPPPLIETAWFADERRLDARRLGDRTSRRSSPLPLPVVLMWWSSTGAADA